MLEVCDMNESDQLLKRCDQMLSEPECWKFWIKARMLEVLDQICNGKVRPKGRKGW
jgi:hypothetical protein